MIIVSIIIVSYNAREALERCLASLHDAPPQASHEIVVVDNASSDGSTDAARHWRDVRVIEAGANLGFAAASNLGIRASLGDYLLLLNSDTVVPAGAVDRLLEILRAHPDVGVVGPRLVDAHGRPELSFGPMISPWSERQRQRLVLAYAANEPAAVAQVHTLASQTSSPDWVSGACLLVSRSDAESVGLLDERFFMYTEDVDFCASIRARGRRILFTADVEVVHLRGRSAASAPAATRAAYERSHLAFYRKHHPLVVPLLRLYRLLRPSPATRS